MKILVIRLSSLGDVVLSQAFTGELRRKYPAAQIHFVTKQAFVDIVKIFGTVDKVLSYDRSLATHIAISKQRYDLVFDLHCKLSSFLLTLAASPARIYRYKKERLKRLKIVSNHAKTGIDSTVRLYLSALEEAGDYAIPVRLPQPRFSIPVLQAEQQDTNKQVISKQEGKPNIALFPGAAHPTKIFPLTKLSDLISRTGDSYHYFMLGSPAEKPLCSYLAKAHPQSCTDLCGRFGLGELVSIIDQADLVISNDSGPMHLAAALAKPQIAFFGATHPSLGFAPLNDRAIVICEDLACQPCSLHGGEHCPRGDLACLNEISIDRIISAIKTLIPSSK